MPAKKPTKKPASPKSTRTPAAKVKRASGWTAEERAAMRERAKEMQAEAKGGSLDGTREVLAKISAMAEPDRHMASQLHALVMDAVPVLVPRLWYGMPAYSLDGKVLCYFQDAKKFKTRYSTFGFSDRAALDDGEMWPVVFALQAWNANIAARVVALVKKAASR